MQHNSAAPRTTASKTTTELNQNLSDTKAKRDRFNNRQKQQTDK